MRDRHDWWADECACSMCIPDVELPGMWERSDFIETEHGRHSMFDLCDGFTPDGEPCPACAPAEPHICERGHFKHCHALEGSWCTCGAGRETRGRETEDSATSEPGQGGGPGADESPSGR